MVRDEECGCSRTKPDKYGVHRRIGGGLPRKAWRGCRHCHGTSRVSRPTPWLLALPLWYELQVEGVEPEREEGGWEWYGLPDWMMMPELKETFDSAAEAHAALDLAMNRLRVQWWVESQAASDLPAGQ